MKPKYQIIFLLVCLATFSARTALYISLIPPNEMPDEWTHFRQIRLIQYQKAANLGQVKMKRIMQQDMAAYLYVIHKHDRMPDPAKMRDHVDRLESRKIYYRVLGLGLRFLGIDDTLTAFYLCRVISLLSGLAVILCGFFTTRRLFPEHGLIPMFVGGFLALLPQFAAMGAVVSTDKAAELSGAVFFLLLTQAVLKPKWMTWTGIGLLLALLPVIKKTNFYFVPVAALAWLPKWRAWLGRTVNRRKIVWSISTTAAVFFLACIFFPPLAKIVAKLLGMPIVRIWQPGFDPQVFQQQGMINVLVQMVRPLDLGFWQHLYLNVVSLFKSSWAYYGYLNLPLGWAWYAGAWLMAGLSLAGWLRLLYLPDREFVFNEVQGRVLALLALGAFLAVAFVLIRQTAFIRDSLSQGRYIFPALVPLSLVGCLGYLALWPDRWRKYAAAAALANLMVMDLAGVWQTLIPHYYYLVF